MLENNRIWDKFRNSVKKEFVRERKKYLWTKIRSCQYKIKAYFHNDEIPKEDSDCICLLSILTDSALKKDENCSPQIIL